MARTDRRIIVYIAASLDGYIAGPNGELDFLSAVERPGEDYGYAAFTTTIDTVIMGRKTYDVVCGFGIPFPHADKQCFILTRQERPQEGNIIFYTGDVPELIRTLRTTPGKDVFVDGGAEVVNLLLRERCVDGLILSVIPVLLGNGILLFSGGRPTVPAELVTSQAFPSGLVQLHYRFTNDNH